MARKCLLIVLPYLVQFGSASDKKKKEVRSFLAFPYGALTIASYINKYTKNGSQCSILDLNVLVNRGNSDSEVLEYVLRKVRDTFVEVVAYSMSFDVSFPWLEKFARTVKKSFPQTLQIAGGPSITTGLIELEKLVPEIDGWCFSEGERPLLSLLDSDEPFSIQLSLDPWHSRYRQGQPKPNAVYEDLDRVIDVDYQLVESDAYSMREAFSPFTKFHEGAKQFFIVTSRGCPFKCVFCAEPAFHGANMRYSSVEKIVEHVGHLVDKYGLTVLTIYDDQLLMHRERAKDLFRGLARYNIRIEMPNGVTLSYIDEELAILMRAAGVDTLFLAVEHGSRRVLREVIKKPLAFERVSSTVELLQKNNIFCVAFLVFGLPGEMPSERLETRKFILESGFDWSFMNYATPLRGSELFENSKRNGWISEEYLRFGAIDMCDYILNSPNIEPEKIKREMFLLNLDLNFVNNGSMKRGDYTTAIRAFREVIFRHEAQPFAHFYLSECLRFTGDIDSARTHLSRALEIFKSDRDWFDAAIALGIEIDARRVATFEDSERLVVV